MREQGNPDTAPPVEPGKVAEPLEPESLATAPAPSESVLLENPHAVATAPSESMEGVVTVEQSETSDLEVSASGTSSTPEVFGSAAAAEPMLLENPNEPRPAPSEGSSDVVTLEGSTPPAPSSAPPIQAAAQAVRPVPNRPRLRATFHYDHQDTIVVELTLMNERRELVHRMTLRPLAGSTFARIFDALAGVAMQSAADAGVFGNRG